MALDATRIHVPFWDSLGFIDAYFDHRAASGWLAYAWLPDNEHHSVWSRLLMLVEIEAFDGNGLSFQVFGTACLLAAAAALYLAFARAGASAPIVRHAFMLICMLVFTVPAAVDCAVAMNGGYVHATGFTVLALAAFGLADRAPWRYGGLAILAAIAASFGNAVGLLAWPILAWSAARGGMGWRWVLALAGLGIAFVVAYLAHLLDGGSAGSPGRLLVDLSPERLRRLADYALAYAGLPWTRSASLAIPGRIVGAALLAAAAWALAAHGLWRKLPRLELLCLGLILFSLGTLALATLGRVDQTMAVAVPVRYAVMMAPLQLGLLGLCWRHAARISTAWVPQASAALLAAAAVLLVAQLAAVPAAIAGSSTIAATVHRYIAGERDDSMQRVVYPDIAEADRIFARMRQAGIYCWLADATFCDPPRIP